MSSTATALSTCVQLCSNRSLRSRSDESWRLVQTGGRLEPTTPDAVQPRRTASGHAGHRPTSPAGGRPRPARPTTGRPPARQSDQRPAWPTYEIQNVKTPEFKLAALSGRFWDTSFFGSMVNQRPATGQPGTHHSGHGRPGRPAPGQAGRRPASPDGLRTRRPTAGSVRPGRPETRTSLQGLHTSPARPFV